MGVALESIVATASGNLIGIGYNSSTEQNFLESINPISESAVTIANFTISGGGWFPTTFTSSGNDVYLESATDTLYEFDATTGSLIGTLSLGASYESLSGVPQLPALFTTGADTVDFNSLTAAQQSAIASGANIYNGLGGDDVVTLPVVANYDESVGGGMTLGWTNTSASTFTTGSREGDTYQVFGGDGDYFIDEGAGTEFITIDGDGSSTISPGSGDDTISIGGGGSLDVTGALKGSATVAGSSTLEILGSGSTANIAFASGATNATLKIDGSVMPTGLISGLAVDETIDLTGVAYDSSGGATVLEQDGKNYTLQITENGKPYDLNLVLPSNFSGSFQLSSDGNTTSSPSGGTKVTVSANPVVGYSTSVSPYNIICGVTPLTTPEYVQAITGLTDWLPDGTGFFISPHFVLTAAHVVDIPGTNNVEPYIELQIGYNGHHAENPKPIYIPSSDVVSDLAFVKSTSGQEYPEDAANDIAIIYVPDYDGLNYFYREPNYSGSTLNVTGYARDTTFNTNAMQVNYLDRLSNNARYWWTLWFSKQLTWLHGDSGGPDWIDTQSGSSLAYAVNVTESYSLAFTQQTLDTIGNMERQLLQSKAAGPWYSLTNYPADPTSFDSISGGFTLSGTSSGISTALDQLDDPNISAIIVSDSAPITASIAQIASDASALTILVNANGATGCEPKLRIYAARFRERFGRLRFAGVAALAASAVQ